MSNSDGFRSTKGVESSTDEYNAMAYIIRQIMSGAHHVAIVKLVSTDGDRVNVQPMVNMLDGQDNAIPHGIINGLIYARWQAGTSALVLSPVIGDIGLALFADRDISSVKETRDLSNPGSMRQFDMADGIYLGGVLNAEPTQYIRMNDDGILIYSPTSIRMQAVNSIILTAPNITANASSGFTVNGPTTLNGAVTATSTIDATGNITAPDVIAGGKSGANHFHVAQGATAPTTTPRP